MALFAAVGYTGRIKANGGQIHDPGRKITAVAQIARLIAGAARRGAGCLAAGHQSAEPPKREKVRETLRKNADWAGYALAIIGAALLLRLLVSIIVMLSLGGWDAFPAVLWTCLPHILAYAVLIAGGIFLARWLKKRGEKHDDL